MGKITAIIPDDLEKKLRILIAKKWSKTKGQLSKAIEEAVKLWIEKTEKELASNK